MKDEKEEVQNLRVEGEEEPRKCDKNNPTDPHYADRDKGDYNATCVWIWDLG